MEHDAALRTRRGRPRAVPGVPLGRDHGPIGTVTSVPAASPRIHRDVVSYVRRSARMNPSQQRAWDSLREGLTVAVPARERSTSVAAEARVDWDAAFGRAAPLVVEIGSGTGEAVAAVASAHPERNVVSFEVFLPAVASAMARVAREGLTNVRFVVADGAEGVARLFGPGAVAELLVFFPDPWHKARHHKRRLVSADFADNAARVLAPGAAWRLATDWSDYATAIREMVGAHPAFVNPYAGWAPRWDLRPVTKYEARGRAAGREIFDLTYLRR